MRLLVILPFLAACSSPTGGIEVRTVETPILVPVSCVARGDIPVEPERVGDKLTGDAIKDLGIISVSTLQLRAAFGEAVALLNACVID
jgi:hypothetical protein